MITFLHFEMSTSLNLGRIKIQVDNHVSGKGMAVLGPSTMKYHEVPELEPRPNF
jgi:hypothetical protein